MFICVGSINELDENISHKILFTCFFLSPFFYWVGRGTDEEETLLVLIVEIYVNNLVIDHCAQEV